MGEILKRVLLILGVFILFVLAYMLIVAGSQYSDSGEVSFDLLKYLGLGEEEEVVPVVRPVNFINRSLEDVGESGQEASATPQVDSSAGAETPAGSGLYLSPDNYRGNLASPTPGPANNYKYNTPQAPLDAF